MKSDSLLMTMITFFLGLAGIILFAGCEVEAYMPQQTETYAETAVPAGTATIRGTVASFERQSLHDALLAVKPVDDDTSGIVVHLNGPVSITAETDSRGCFAFTELAAGSYEISFECDGEEVRYRGNSGQAAVLTVSGDQVLEMTGIKVSGGRVNIGNIRIRQTHVAVVDEDEDDPDEEDDDDEVVDLSGTWLLTKVDAEGVLNQEQLVLTQYGSVLSGALLESPSVVLGETDGSSLWLRVESMLVEMIVVFEFTGTVESETAMHGTWHSTDGQQGVWEGNKMAF
jgi:hypothetical protein